MKTWLEAAGGSGKNHVYFQQERRESGQSPRYEAARLTFLTPGGQTSGARKFLARGCAAEHGTSRIVKTSGESANT